MSVSFREIHEVYIHFFLCVQRQATAVGVLLSFFRLGVLELKVGIDRLTRFGKQNVVAAEASKIATAHYSCRVQPKHIHSAGRFLMHILAVVCKGELDHSTLDIVWARLYPVPSLLSH